MNSLFSSHKYAPLMRFLVCGCVTTSLDFILYISLSTCGVPIFGAKFLSGAITMILSFILNRTWSFQATNGNATKQGWKFILSQLLSISVNTTTNSIVLSLLNIKLIAFGCATFVGMTINFLLQRFWVFQQKGEPNT